MKNFSKLFAIALASLSLSASAGTVLLTTDVADPNGVDGAAGPNDSLSIVNVAKIRGVLEVRLSNDGLVADSNEQRFAFGQPKAVGGNAAIAETYEVDPNATGLEAHTCSGAGTAHVQRLWDAQTDAALAGSCVIGTGTDKQVDMNFKVKYRIDAAGGINATMALFVNNGVDAGLAPDVTLAFQSAGLSEIATTRLLSAPITIGAAGGVANNASPVISGAMDDASGVLSYALSFDIAGSGSKAESRALFQHVLSIAP